jgi:hypothetical protein
MEAEDAETEGSPEMTYPREVDLETPEVDAAEQAATVRGWQDEESDEPESPEENRIVEFDDDYR